VSGSVDACQDQVDACQDQVDACQDQVDACQDRSTRVRIGRRASGSGGRASGSVDACQDRSARVRIGWTRVRIGWTRVRIGWTRGAVCGPMSARRSRSLAQSLCASAAVCGPATRSKQYQRQLARAQQGRACHQRGRTRGCQGTAIPLRRSSKCSRPSCASPESRHNS